MPRLTPRKRCTRFRISVLLVSNEGSLRPSVLLERAADWTGKCAEEVLYEGWKNGWKVPLKFSDFAS